MSKKTIVVVGATGNQEGSVAQRFLRDPGWHVRALTRNPSSEASKKLSEAGAEVVAAELDDVESLKAAFKGANLIFSGKNTVDTATIVVNTLDDNGFIPSTLSHTRKVALGKYPNLFHFDAKADIFSVYVQEKYPKLTAKISCVQTGYFTSSYLFVPDVYCSKKLNGSILIAFPILGDEAVPYLDVNADTGNFVYTVSQLPPGKHYMASGMDYGWAKYIRLFYEVTGAKATYKEKPIDDFFRDIPDKMFGEELGDMFLYSGNPGV